MRWARSGSSFGIGTAIGRCVSPERTSRCRSTGRSTTPSERRRSSWRNPGAARWWSTSDLRSAATPLSCVVEAAASGESGVSRDDLLHVGVEPASPGTVAQHQRGVREAAPQSHLEVVPQVRVPGAGCDRRAAGDPVDQRSHRRPELFAHNQREHGTSGVRHWSMSFFDTTLYRFSARCDGRWTSVPAQYDCATLLA